MENSIHICTFVLGAIVGSFLNVCIYRIPARISLVFPGSCCPVCKAEVLWYQNVPLLSWLLLGGKCAACRGPISFRYPLVELLTGLLFSLGFWRFGMATATPVYWTFLSALVVITFIDLDHQIIPDVISLPGIVLGFLFSFAIPWLSWADSLLGILLGGGSLWAVSACYKLLTRAEGMGMGDVKLLAMLGAFLGWKAILPVIFMSSLLGTLVGVPVMLAKGAGGKYAIPFGPFLALGGVVYLFWGPLLIRWYLSFFALI